MRKIFICLLLLGCTVCDAATVVWGETASYRQPQPDTFMLYAEFEGLYEGLLLISTPSEIYVSVANVGAGQFKLTFYHENYGSYENWVVAQQGAKVDATTTRLLPDDSYLLHFMLDDGRYLGPNEITVDANVGLYLAFVCSDVTGYSSPDRAPYVYGWVELAVDGDGNVVVLSSAADLDGGPMIVGGGAWTGIPEPSGGMLMLLGLAALGLRRREFSVPSP